MVIIIMPQIRNNKITTSAIFYRTGIPNSDKSFAYLATQNYSVVKQIYRYHKENPYNSDRSQFKLF
jgi:hypothetical protein